VHRSLKSVMIGDPGKRWFSTFSSRKVLPFYSVFRTSLLRGVCYNWSRFFLFPLRNQSRRLQNSNLGNGKLGFQR